MNLICQGCFIRFPASKWMSALRRGERCRRCGRLGKVPPRVLRRVLAGTLGYFALCLGVAWAGANHARASALEARRPVVGAPRAASASPAVSGGGSVPAPPLPAAASSAPAPALASSPAPDDGAKKKVRSGKRRFSKRARKLSRRHDAATARRKSSERRHSAPASGSASVPRKKKAVADDFARMFGE